MKKMLIVLIAVLVVVAMASVSFAVVSATKHNLSASNTTASPHTANAAATVCGFCHIPHGGDLTLVGVPLWSRDLTSVVNTYTVYGGTVAGANGVTLSNTVVGQPGANSLTCLSCHDGTVGLGVTFKNGQQATNYAIVGGGTGFVVANALDFAGYNAIGAYNPAIGSAASGSLTNDHPVGIDYISSGLNRAGLQAVGGINAALKIYDYSGVGGNAHSVECGTCHDPHDQTNGKFLRMSASTLCQDCHALK